MTLGEIRGNMVRNKKSGIVVAVELGHIRSLVPLQQLHIYTLAPQVLLISDPLPESTHRQPQ